MRNHRLLFLVASGIAVLTTAMLAQGSAADESVAKRQFDGATAFARQGNYVEALKDFKAVAANFGSTAVADNALLEIARYYLDIVGDVGEAATAVDQILKKYPTSDSAPDAYVLGGRLALAKGHQAADLDAARANFERVPSIFPASSAVPRALQLAGDTLWYAKRYDEALMNLGRVEAEFATDAAAADAYLSAGRVLVSGGDPIGAMEALQQVRTRWPKSPEADIALARTTLLHRLYVRARSGPAYALSVETIGPTKLENVIAVAVNGRNALYWATESAVVAGAPAIADRAPAVAKPRGLAVDAIGGLVIFDGNQIQSATGAAIAFGLPKQNGEVDPLRVEAAVQLSNGDWVVSDADQKAIYRFSRAGVFSSMFAPIKVTHLAVNAMDEVAGIDRDQKSVAIFDATGRLLTRIPLKAPAASGGYDLQDPEGLAYDAFGHLYLLDRGAIAVFTPHPDAPPKAVGPAPAGVPMTAYRLLTSYTEPEKSPAAFRKATSFAIDSSGTIYLYDGNAKRVMAYR